mmetsp:Transcript_22146/g.52491  ORF Transcript_22146/g.52491 Transcript_22146/m.52491 type:complete len:253 (+) Transcript_22146:1879-2637(+)
MRMLRLLLLVLLLLQQQLLELLLLVVLLVLLLELLLQLRLRLLVLLLRLLLLLLLLLRLRGLRRRRWHGGSVGGLCGGLCGVRALGGVEGLVVRARADRDGVGRGVRVGRGELADAEAGERLHHRAALVVGRGGRLPLVAVALRAAVEEGAVLARVRAVGGDHTSVAAQLGERRRERRHLLESDPGHPRERRAEGRGRLAAVVAARRGEAAAQARARHALAGREGAVGGRVLHASGDLHRHGGGPRRLRVGQ